MRKGLLLLFTCSLFFTTEGILSAQVNNALDFDGSNDWVDCQSVRGLPQTTQPRTVEAWVRTRQASIGNIVSWGTRSSQKRNSIAVRSGRFAFIGEFNDHTSNKFINDGQWHHVAFTYNGSALSLYVDGSRYYYRTGVRLGTVGDNLRIGKVSFPHNVEYFDGTIDEVRIWDIAKTQAQINLSKGKELIGNEANLVAYYNFNQGVPSGDNRSVRNLVNARNTGNGNVTNFNLYNTSYSNWVSGPNVVQNAVWTGAVSRDWANAGNWSGGAVPALNANVQIPVTTNQPLIAAGSHVHINALVVFPGTMVTVLSNATSNGSLIVDGNSTGMVQYDRYVTGGTNNSPWHLIASPVQGQSIADMVNNTPLASNGSMVALAPYNNNTPGWDFYTTAAGSHVPSGNFIPGVGMQTLRSSSGVISFKGSMVNGNVSVPTSSNSAPGNAWNLGGNPYTAAINVNAAAGLRNILSANIEGLEPSYLAVYLWDADAASPQYVAVNQASAPTSIAPGQAFFVHAFSGGASLEFSPSMRNGATGNIFKSASKNNASIRLSVSNGNAKTATEIYYIEGATAALDPGYDAGRFTGLANELTLFSKLAGDFTHPVEFAIQSLPSNDFSQAVPLGIISRAGSELTFSVNTMNLPIGVPVLLEDRANGTFIDLIEKESYTVSLQNNMNGTGRFYLHTAYAATPIATVDAELQILIKPQASENSLLISGNVGDNARIDVFSLAGQRLINQPLHYASNNRVSMQNLESGTYVVRILSTNSTITQTILWQK